jgi:hypothetical protein
MPLFRESFRPHIKQELEYRRTHKGRQDVFSPVVRVTSLVQGTLYGNTIRGLTLGLSDYRESSLDSLTNISGKGSAIGTTYVDRNRPSTVFIPSKVNLPSPGVTDVSISTQSKGGLVFKAQVNFKFYGKEQYDFLYQTFMRPGTPILLEYGHLRTNYDDIKTKSDVDNTVNLLRDLKFFKDLDSPTINSFEQDLYQTAKLVANRESGAVVGLVSNFKTSLNENNEYEATIDLINALEYMFALSPEDTFLSFENPSLSKSIRANFGNMNDMDYDEKYDRIFQFILRDCGLAYREGDELIQGQAPAFLGGRGWQPAGNHKYGKFINMGYIGELDRFAESDASFGSAPKESAAVPYGDESYIDIIYLLNRLVPVILKASVEDSENCEVQDTVLFMTGAQIESLTGFRTGTATDNRGERPQEDRRIRELTQSEKDRVNDRVNQKFFETASEMLDGNLNSFMFFIEPPSSGGPRYFKTLRSINTKDVIINNDSLYPLRTEGALNGNGNSAEYWQGLYNVYQNIINGYIEKFDMNQIPATPGIEASVEQRAAGKTLEIFFKYSSVIERNNVRYSEDTPFQGIFINYNVIRNSFLGSNSLSEAIIKILNKINSSTNGILNLKLRYSLVEATGETLLTIYDENNFPKKQDVIDLYGFFEDDISEALSYNFDFSLPNSVASVVVADSFRDDTRNIVGDASTYQLFRNGYLKNEDGEDAITPLIGANKLQGPQNCTKQNIFDKLNPILEEGTGALSGIMSFFANSGLSDAEKRAIEIAQSEKELFSSITAYKEYNPPVMKVEGINQGMLNTIPTSAKVTIKLVGLDGFRFGDMFTVRNMLPLC